MNDSTRSNLLSDTDKAIEVWESELVVWTDRMNEGRFIDAWTGEVIDYDPDQIALIKNKVDKCNKKLVYYKGIKEVLEKYQKGDVT